MLDFNGLEYDRGLVTSDLTLYKALSKILQRGITHIVTLDLDLAAGYLAAPWEMVKKP